MKVSPFITIKYVKMDTCLCWKNKPNQTQFKPKTNPIPKMLKMNVNIYYTKDYSNKTAFRRIKNKPNSNPNKPNWSSILRPKVCPRFRLLCFSAGGPLFPDEVVFSLDFADQPVILKCEHSAASPANEKRTHLNNSRQERKHIMSIDRRTFLRGSVAASVAFAAPNILMADRAAKYRTALIGSGWWGMNIATEAIQSGQCNMVAMCDVDSNQLDPAVKRVEKLTGRTPKKYKDYRELLDREKPDIAIVATPDHWHPLITIAAVEAGAHVYVEKPISHTIHEGLAMVKAARAANRVVQVGTHRRISPHNVSGMKFLKEGRAGKIGMVRAFVLYGGGPEQPRKNLEPPEGLDWDMWCGPAPLRPFNTKIHPKGFRQFLDYGNGTLGDWGVHWVDQILWIMEEKWPKTVFSTGGRPIKGPPVNDERGQTTDSPDHQLATYEFEDFTAYWEHRQFAGNPAEKGAGPSTR